MPGTPANSQPLRAPPGPVGYPWVWRGRHRAGPKQIQPARSAIQNIWKIRQKYSIYGCARARLVRFRVRKENAAMLAYRLFMAEMDNVPDGVFQRIGAALGAGFQPCIGPARELQASLLGIEPQSLSAEPVPPTAPLRPGGGRGHHRRGDFLQQIQLRRDHRRDEGCARAAHPVQRRRPGAAGRRPSGRSACPCSTWAPPTSRSTSRRSRARSRPPSA